MTTWDEKRELEVRNLITHRSQAHVRELLDAYDALKRENAELKEDAEAFDVVLSETVEIHAEPLHKEIDRLRGLLTGISSIANMVSPHPYSAPAIQLANGCSPAPAVQLVGGEMWRETPEQAARTVRCDVVGCFTPSHETQNGHELCCPHAVEYHFGRGPQFEFKSVSVGGVR